MGWSEFFLSRYHYNPVTFVWQMPDALVVAGLVINIDEKFKQSKYKVTLCIPI